VRICIIGKFPPIQGGVSMRTYWTAHGLAARGHEVHVVTNAKEARPPFRMHMRRQDWKRCEATYGDGSVTVHWTDPLDSSQFYIPLASAFVSKLAATAARVNSERPFEVVYSHYLEPYGVAGHLAAEIARVPHVVRMAGSDAGRLWHHPQFESLYDHVLRSAAAVIASGTVAGRAIKHGVGAERIAAVGGPDIPEDLFCPDGAALDLGALRRELESDPDLRDSLWGGFAGRIPYFGIYGKLGETKGSFALLAAMRRLQQARIDVGLVAMAHGWPALESKFRARAEELGLADRILQIPFLPHWRVPEFLRSCLAVGCLEQDFPIVFHSPVVAREVLMCGACLIGSTEVIRKLPGYERLPSGYGCVAIDDVQDVDSLSARLAAIANDPEPITAVAARGRAFARALQADTRDPDGLEHLLESVVRKRVSSKRGGPVAAASGEPQDPRFPITALAAQTLQEQPDGADAGRLAASLPIGLPQAREVLAATERGMERGDSDLRSVASAIRLEIAIAEAEGTAAAPDKAQSIDPLFRLSAKRWAMAEGDLAGLVPVRDPQLRIIAIDISDLMDCAPESERPAAAAEGPRHAVAFARSSGERRAPLFISDTTARILELSDGTRTALEIVAELRSDHEPAVGPQVLRQVEDLFVSGLLSLHEGRVDRINTAGPGSDGSSPNHGHRPACPAGVK
jgi:glycosyltransferase involved in cell wall biosynthesis